MLSDTHIPQAEKALPSEVPEAFRGVDLILHAGDIYLTSVLDDLERVAPVLAARGDDDWGATLADRRVKDKHVLEIEGRVVWLVHQRPYYPLISQQQRSASLEQDKDGAPSIVIFGHEHRTNVWEESGILFINPGSPTFLKYLRGLGSIGFLDINDGEVNAQILHL